MALGSEKLLTEERLSQPVIAHRGQNLSSRRQIQRGTGRVMGFLRLEESWSQGGTFPKSTHTHMYGRIHWREGSAYAGKGQLTIAAASPEASYKPAPLLQNKNKSKAGVFFQFSSRNIAASGWHTQGSRVTGLIALLLNTLTHT